MQREVTPIFGKKKVVLRETPRAVTPFGGLSVFIEFLGKIGYRQQVREHMPVHLKSPNAIDPGETFTAFLIAVVAGARRFAHTSWLRSDRALQALLGMERFPTDGTIRNLFKRFTQGMVVRMYEPLWAWQVRRLPQREKGYSLDLDSTVFERYGSQEGVKKGYNPRQPGRGSHHPLLAVLGEAHFILHGWLRSGNTASGRGAVEFLKEALAKLESREWIRVVRADSGFFDQELLSYLEGEKLSYLVVARLTRWLKAGGGAGRDMASGGRDLLGRRVSVAALRMGSSPAFCRRAGAVAREEALARAEVVRDSRLHVSPLRDQPTGLAGRDLAGL